MNILPIVAIVLICFPGTLSALNFTRFTNSNIFDVKNVVFESIKNNPKLSLVALAALSASYCGYNSTVTYGREWDWKKINIDEELKNFKTPQGFHWGTSTAEYQVSGAKNLPNSQWAHWELQHADQTKKFHMPQSGDACNSIHMREEDIACMKNLGINTYRFSVDWSLVEPKQGEIDEKVLQDYSNFCDRLAQEGIQPVIALYHQVHPQWFTQIGGFEKEENLAHFVSFCELVFNKMNKHVKLWTVAAEPTTHMLQGYIRGVTPPGYVCAFKKAGEVLKNLLYAQVLVYKKLKTLPGGQEAQIGFAHGVLRFKSYYSWNPITRIITSYLNHMLNDTVMEFFKTGKYRFKIPGASVEFDCPEACNSFDFAGLDYYSRVLLQTTGEAFRPQDIRTDMPYAMYPEGLYDAIAELAQLKKPIYILENGIADAKDDRRELWIKRHMYALKRALDDGYDVQGFFYWSLLDNYEWDMGYEQKFGLYEVDMVTKKRTLRQGSQAYKNIIATAQHA